MGVASHDLSAVDGLNDSTLALPTTSASVQNQGVEAFKDVAFGSVRVTSPIMIAFTHDCFRSQAFLENSSSTLSIQ